MSTRATQSTRAREQKKPGRSRSVKSDNLQPRDTTQKKVRPSRARARAASDEAPPTSRSASSEPSAAPADAPRKRQKSTARDLAGRSSVRAQGASVVSGEPEVRWVPLREVRKWPRNPKRHDIAAIQSSLRRFGVVELPARDERTGQLVAGHGRDEALEQMRDLGEPPPGRVRALPDGDWAVPVLCGLSFASEGDAEAYLVASNRTSELGGWDEADLGAMLSRIASQEAGLLSVTGYSEQQLTKLLTRSTSAQQDAMPSRIEKRCRSGDVWLLGASRLHCASSIDEKGVSAALGADKCATLVTSPPYWTGQPYDDAPAVDGIRDFMLRFVDAWQGHVVRRIQIQTSTTTAKLAGQKSEGGRRLWLDYYWTEAFAQRGWLLRHRRIWSKSGPLVHVNPVADCIDQNWEMILTYDRPKHNEGGQERTQQAWAIAGVWDVPPQTGFDGHPCPYPVEIASRMIQLYSRVGDLVAEPFSGSGTTLITCEQLGRRCIAFDLSPDYCDVAIARWEQLTGQKALKG